MFFEIGDVYNYDGRVDATDPCYDRATYESGDCGVAGIPLVPGAYQGFIDMVDTGSFGTRVGRLVVVPNGAVQGATVEDYLRGLECEELGVVGVDAGMAGIFQGKPDFVDDEWLDFCENEGLFDGQYWCTRYGFCSESGTGDGGYLCYGYYDSDDDVVAVEIRFL